MSAGRAIRPDVGGRAGPARFVPPYDLDSCVSLRLPRWTGAHCLVPRWLPVADGIFSAAAFSPGWFMGDVWKRPAGRGDRLHRDL